MQNFNFSKFLRNPLYQRNLVKFVKEGGGLLFIGGRRALSGADLSGSPLQELLPFKPKGSDPVVDDSWLMNRGRSRSSSFDSNLKFQVKMAKPSEKQRKFANIYDHWLSFKRHFEGVGWLKGMHKTQGFDFDLQNATPILEAQLEGGGKVPLAVASYPGKGRALWLFTDQFWHYSMRDQSSSPRLFHSKMMQSTLNWLMGDNFEKPLQIKNFRVNSFAGKWQVEVSGESVPYLNKRQGKWSFLACEKNYNLDELYYKNLSDRKVLVSGNLDTDESRKYCNLKVASEHPSYGRLQESIFAPVFGRVKDKQLGASSAWIKKFSKKVSASYYDSSSKKSLEGSLLNWLKLQKNIKTVPLASNSKVQIDYHWIFKTPWIWLCLLALPLEVLVRRYREIFGS